MIWNPFRRAPPRIDAARFLAVEEALPLLDHLAPAQRLALRQMALEFIAGRQWHGAHGLKLQQEMQLAISLQACLLVLELGLGWYDDWVGIVVYPGDFLIPRAQTDPDGVVHEYDEAALGEAWEGGPLLISWFAGPNGSAQRWEVEGVNIVIHEFAHKLDMRSGSADGMPPLHPGMSAQRWRQAFAPAYADFCQRVDGGEDTELDPYAAESPAEFFAVLSESFFEDPALLQGEYPQVYAQLRQFYRQDPLQRCMMTKS